MLEYLEELEETKALLKALEKITKEDLKKIVII